MNFNYFLIWNEISPVTVSAEPAHEVRGPEANPQLGAFYIESYKNLKSKIKLNIY